MIPLLALDLPRVADVAKPCRPTISCTADITTPGTLEIEAGGNASGTNTGTRAWSFPFLLKQTVTKGLQLQLGSNGFVTVSPTTRYFDNLIIGPKFRFVDQGTVRPSLAITAQLSVPTVAQPGYTPHTSAFFTGHASKDIGPVHIDLNGGLNVWTLEGPAVVQGFGAFALAYALPAPFAAAVEVYGFTDANPAAVPDGGVRFVLAATPRPWVVFDIGADAGFFPSTRAFSVFFGMTIIPVVFWR